MARKYTTTELSDSLFPQTEGGFQQRCFLALRIVLSALALSIALYVFSVAFLIGG